MAEMGERTGELVDEDGGAVVRRRRRRVFGLLLCDGLAFRRGEGAVARRRLSHAQGGEKAMERRRKKASPAPLFIRGGVVTGVVTTPPGSPVVQQLGNLCVAMQIRV